MKALASKFQEQFWLLNRLAKESPAYNIATAIKTDKKPNAAILEECINILINRHSSLRASFNFDEEKLWQHIAPEASANIRITQIDHSASVPDELSDDIIQVIEQPFDLSTAPLIRVHLFNYTNGSILSIVFHHIVIDLHSKDVFSDELSQLYNAKIKNHDIKLESTGKQYIDFSEHHNNWLSSGDSSSAIAKWNKELEGSNILLELPNDYSRPQFSTLSGKRKLFSIDNKTTSDVHEYALHNSSYSFVILLTAYAIMLNRISKQNKIIIGVPLTNRRNSSFTNTIGCFVNVVPLVVDFEDNYCGNDIRKQIRQKLLLAHRKQEVPFLSLLKNLEGKRDTSFNPFFQTGFTFEHPMKLDLHDLKCTTLPIEKKGSQLDIFFTMWEDAGQFKGYIEYADTLFSENTIERFEDYFTQTIGELIYKEQKVNNFSLLSEKDKLQQIAFNNTEAAIKNTFIHDFVENQISIQKDKTALIFDSKERSYDELNTKANQLANYLIKNDLQQNQTVGICLQRSDALIISILAVLKAGATYLPLDPSFPHDRLSYMLKDSGAAILITEPTLENSFSNIDAKQVVIDNIDNFVEQESVEKPVITINSDSIAYIIYTSGSTGKPKGVKVHHKAAVNFIESMASKPGFTNNDVLLAVTTLSFDISVLEIFLPLCCGGSIVLAKKADTINGKQLINLIHTHGVTVLQATPATWNILLFSGWEGNSELKALCGGEAIPISLVQQLLPKVGELWNMYGPTETTVWSTCHQITENKPPVLIGKPINNTTIYILSPEGKQLPIGLTGEVCIGGDGVSKGYHNRQDLTNEMFIRGPLGDTIYRTGDLGKFRPDGNIELYGRIDNQIKLRGFRIEPSEIETLLCKIDGVNEAVVKVQKFSELDERLIAFVNADENTEQTSEQLSQLLKKDLPDYMIPSNYEILNKFPRTPNGKIDKKSLIYTIPEATEINSASGSIDLPEQEIEKEILKIWIDALKVSSIGVNDNFFDIGGNSINLIQVSTAINKFLGKEINIMHYFEHSTIKSFSAFVSDKPSETQSTEAVAAPDKKHLRQAARRRRQNN